MKKMWSFAFGGGNNLRNGASYALDDRYASRGCLEFVGLENDGVEQERMYLYCIR